MKLVFSRCIRFSALLDSEGEKEWTPRQSKFIEEHRKSCPQCAREERASRMSLDMLRGAGMQCQEAPFFDERLLRRVKLQQVRDSVRYWSPAMVGAGLAGMILFVTLHLIGNNPARRSYDPGAGEARRVTHSKPSLVLDRIPSLTQ